LRGIVIPEEPPKGPDVIEIRFILPNGHILTRRFKKNSTFNDLKDYIDTREIYEGLEIPENYIFVEDFPRKEYRNFNSTLEAEGIAKRAKLHVHDLV